MARVPYMLAMQKASITTKRGNVIETMTWVVLRGEAELEVFYDIMDASNYITLLEKRDADLDSLTGSV